MSVTALAFAVGLVAGLLIAGLGWFAQQLLTMRREAHEVFDTYQALTDAKADTHFRAHLNAQTAATTPEGTR